LNPGQRSIVLRTDALRDRLGTTSDRPLARPRELRRETVPLERRRSR
jgi:hypothetical protein